jgi:hypothetical protein
MKKYSCIALNIIPMIGSKPKECIQQCIDLSKDLNIGTNLAINGINLYIYPDSSIEETYNQYVYFLNI